MILLKTHSFYITPPNLSVRVFLMEQILTLFWRKIRSECSRFRFHMSSGVLRWIKSNRYQKAAVGSCDIKAKQQIQPDWVTPCSLKILETEKNILFFELWCNTQGLIFWFNGNFTFLRQLRRKNVLIYLLKYQHYESLTDPNILHNLKRKLDIMK